MTRALLGLALATFAVGCAAGAREVPLWEQPGLYGAVRPEMGAPQPGDRAPDFELPSATGTFRSASLRGHWVVLHFTASWCPYCDAEVEHLGALAAEYEARNVQVVLVDLEEDEPRWAEYAKAHVAPPVLAIRDATGDAARRFAPPGAQPSFQDRAQVLLDSTLILDPEGKIRLFLFPDSRHFDPTFAAVRLRLDAAIGAPRAPLTPEQVVAVEAPAVIATAGTKGEAVVTLRVAPGYHVMSNRPSAPEYIATRVAASPSEGLVWGEPQYPAPVPFELAERAIDTFQGTVAIRCPFTVSAATAAGDREVEVTLRYQACTRTSCLFPVTRRVPIGVRLTGR